MKPRRFVEIGKPRIDDRYNVWVLENCEWFIAGVVDDWREAMELVGRLRQKVGS